MFETYRENVQTALRGMSKERVREAAELLRRVRFQNATVYLVGNGGSATTASHFANDLLKMGKIRAVALSDLTPAMLAYGNDRGWDNMFVDMLYPMVLPQDLLIAFSCSGNSPNIVKCIRFMREYNLPSLKTIAMIGADLDCDVAREKPDVLINVPFRDIRVQEDCHLIVCHTIAGALSRETAGKM